MMESGGSSALAIVLWVLAANAVLILTAYGLVYFWRKQTQEAVQQIGEQIQALNGQIDKIAGFTQEYLGIEEEPYSTHLGNLQSETGELQDHIDRLDQTRRNFEAEIQTPGANRLQEIINAPFNWFRRWRRSAALREEGRVIAERLSEAESRVVQITELPWDEATQSRQVDKDVDELISIAQDLRAKGVRGDGFKIVLDQVPLLQRAMDEIPPEFLDSDHDTLLNAANLDSTIRVFSVLGRVRPAVNRYLPQLRDWRSSYEKASADFAALKQAGASLRQVIATPPAGLVITSMQTRLDQVAQMAGDLSQRLTQPEAEQLKTLAREVSRLLRVIQDTEQLLNRSSQQVSELSKLLGELQDEQGRLGEQVAELERREVYPLNWDESSIQINEMRLRLQALGPAQQPRTPEQVTQHMKEAEILRAGQKRQAEALPKVADQYRALLALLESPEIREGAAWLRKTRELFHQVDLYDPRNWPKPDSIQTLPAELEDLSSTHERLVPADPVTPVKESELPQRLKDTQQLSVRHKELRPRVESVRARLEKVKAMEQESKDKLEDSFKMLETVDLLTNSNDLLHEIASAEISRQREEIRLLGNELNAQNQGEVEKKLQKISAQAEKVNKSLNGWLARLTSSIVEQGKRINERIVQLDAIAMLEDLPIADARNLLSHEDYLTAAHGSQSSPLQTGPLRGMAARVTRHTQATLDNLEATAQIKRKNDLWQKLIAAEQALEEKTGAILAAYQETIKARSEAQEGLAEVARRIPQQRTWPPSNQTQVTEAQLLKPINERWEALKREPRRIETAILELGRLMQQYQNAVERIRQLLDRVDQDQERITDLEEQIGELKQRWQDQALVDSATPVVREGVQQLMSESDSKLAYIKHQYMRGIISYEQAIHSLTLLYDELFSARVSVDDQNDIGLNGNNNNNRRIHQARNN